MCLHPIDSWIQLDVMFNRMRHGSHLYVAIMRDACCFTSPEKIQSLFFLTLCAHIGTIELVFQKSNGEKKQAQKGLFDLIIEPEQFVLGLGFPFLAALASYE